MCHRDLRVNFVRRFVVVVVCYLFSPALRAVTVRQHRHWQQRLGKECHLCRCSGQFILFCAPLRKAAGGGGGGGCIRN